MHLCTVICLQYSQPVHTVMSVVQVHLSTVSLPGLVFCADAPNYHVASLVQMCFVPCGICGACMSFCHVASVVQMHLSTFCCLWYRCAFLPCGICSADVPFYFVVSVVWMCLSTFVVSVFAFLLCGVCDANVPLYLVASVVHLHLCTLWHLWYSHTFVPSGISGAVTPLYLVASVVHMHLSTLRCLWCRCIRYLCMLWPTPIRD